MRTKSYDQQYSIAKSIPLQRDQVIARYANLAPVYNEAVAEWGYDGHEIAAGLMRKYARMTGKILDAGCGTGLTGMALYQAGSTQIVGMDLSPVCLSTSKATGVYEKLYEQDLNQAPYPFPDDTFDAVESIAVFTFIDQVKPVLKEFCRVVRPGGFLIFSQRDDLYEQYDYATALKQIEEEGYCRRVEVSKPMPFLSQPYRL